MGEIYILEKSQADRLQSLGFKYSIRNMDNKDVFVFVQTNEIMKELNSKFDESSFYINKNLCF